MTSMLHRTAGVCVLAVLAGAAVAAPQGHPHFNDGGTLAWHQTLAAAKTAAKAADRVILVEYGRAA
jgi:hypothetical protein